MPPAASPAQHLSWRTPLLIIAAGAVISMVGFGPRSVMGFFMNPMSSEAGWGRDVFSLAFAIQNLLWGVGQPFAGAIADRFGTTRVLIVGGVMYAAGLAMMTVATDPLTLYISSGVLIGFGLSGASFNVVLGAFGKLLPAEKRAFALGVGTAAGSFGQFLYSPLAVALIESMGWRGALFAFAGFLILILPLAFVLWTPPLDSGAAASPEPRQSLGAALKEAFAHPSYVFLVIGFFTCGFQLAFITGHLPQYISDQGLPAWVGGWTLAAIGLANIVGSLMSGYWSARLSRRLMLAAIYSLRSVAIMGLLWLPASPATALGFGVAMGLLWLSTIPPTSGLVALMFGTRYMTMLYGFAFFSHQVGGFLGAWLGGVLYESTGGYDIVWWLSIALGFASAAINLPIRERPVERPAPAAA
jgi:MFS family permease